MWPFIGELISGMPFDWPALNSFVFFFIKLSKREQFRLVIDYFTVFPCNQMQKSTALEHLNNTKERG